MNRGIMLLTGFLMILLPGLAAGTPGIMNKFISIYPETKDSQLASCRTCHLPAEKDCLNQYALSLRDNTLDFKAIEDSDADGDGSSNIEEIRNGQLPGSQAMADEVFVFTNRIGAITFNHEKHSLAPEYISGGNCANCHNPDAFPRKFDNTQSWQKIAHPLCKGCHRESGSENAPIRCFDCHDRNNKNTAP